MSTEAQRAQAAGAPEQRQTVTVFDGLLRLIHACNGLCILALLATGLLAQRFEHDASAALLWSLHMQLGYCLAGGLAARLLWGLIGPRSARWSDLWHPRQWRASLRMFPRLRLPPPRLGHDALASALFIVLYLILLGLASSGLALAAIKHDLGPLASWLGDSIWLKSYFQAPHQWLYALVVGFIFLHLGALVWHQFFGTAPVAQAMLTGNQYLGAGKPLALALSPAATPSIHRGVGHAGFDHQAPAFAAGRHRGCRARRFVGVVRQRSQPQQDAASG